MARYQPTNHRKLGWTLGTLAAVGAGVFLYTHEMAPPPAVEPASTSMTPSVPQTAPAPLPSTPEMSPPEAAPPQPGMPEAPMTPSATPSSSGPI